jgi:PPE-repeat protein
LLNRSGVRIALLVLVQLLCACGQLSYSNRTEMVAIAQERSTLPIPVRETSTPSADRARGTLAAGVIAVAIGTGLLAGGVTGLAHQQPCGYLLCGLSDGEAYGTMTAIGAGAALTGAILTIVGARGTARRKAPYGTPRSAENMIPSAVSIHR